jgi:phosphatidylethanolamine/phosphatidyl-N-methylethanolamine N-methyltransferase
MRNSETLPHESEIYARFSDLYDVIFERVFSSRIHEVIAGLGITSQDRVLEVGIGTGISLDAYPMDCGLVGVDLAPEMLLRAKAKAAAAARKNLELREGNALDLPFADNSFDLVTSFHVVSVVPDATRMVEEMSRVCRPGGKIAIINHFRSPRPAVAKLVDHLDPLARKLGWRTTLSVDDLLAGSCIKVQRCYKRSPQSLFTILIGEVVNPAPSVPPEKVRNTAEISAS